MENKLCPHCMTEFDENNKGVYCPTCGIKHHRACFDEKGCANPDCGKVVAPVAKPRSAEELRLEYEARKKAEERALKEQKAKKRYEADLEAIMNDKPLPSDGAVVEESKEPTRTLSQLLIGILGIVFSSIFFLIFTEYDDMGFSGFNAIAGIFLFVSILSKRRIPKRVFNIISLSITGFVSFIVLVLAMADGSVYIDGLIGCLGLAFFNVYLLCNSKKN